MRYIFEPEILQVICKEVLKDIEYSNNDPEQKINELFDKLTDKLAREYPTCIKTDERNWIFNNAGGAMGSLTLLYGSLKEYLIFFGTPIGTHGHSGRYRKADVYDIMLDGEMLCYNEDKITQATYLPGDMAILKRKLAKSYRIPERAWMLEYARGGIPAMIRFGIGDNLYSNFDYKSSNQLIRNYGKMVIKNLFKRKKKGNLPVSEFYRNFITQSKIDSAV